jgi:hypothetical protein
MTAPEVPRSSLLTGRSFQITLALGHQIPAGILGSSMDRTTRFLVHHRQAIIFIEHINSLAPLAQESGSSSALLHGNDIMQLQQRCRCRLQAVLQQMAAPDEFLQVAAACARQQVVQKTFDLAAVVGSSDGEREHLGLLHE